MPNTLLLAWPEFESALEEELEFFGVDFEMLSPRSFLVSSADIKVIPAFCQQALPEVEVLKDLSIRKTAESIAISIPKEGSWKLHLVDEEPARDFEKSGRSKLIDESLKEVLKKSDRFGLKRFIQDETAAADYLVQCLIVSKEVTAVSCSEISGNKQIISCGVGGRVFLEEDKRPPARAYRKLLEALKISGMEISRDQTVVDLGSAPGSWSWVCLELGAKVISVDRSELSPDVMKRKKVTYIPGDAFSYFPEEPVDWLISDIIAYPDRIISMLQTWLKKGLMRNFCVTLKFKGDERGKAIESLREVLKDTQCLIRHMENNKNEITAVGSCSFSA